jgi:2'-hydroxyisoflavone reductase
MQRREFIKDSALIAAAGLLASPLVTAASGRSLNILVLGGTGFLGPHFVRLALERGHTVTLFNRGRSNAQLFPEAKKLVGDRDGGLQALEKGEWDVVLDNSGYVPRHVADSARLLKGRVGRYLFTSTVAVYDFVADNMPLGPGKRLAVLSEPGSEDVGKHYGALKVLCEQHVLDTYGDAATIVRPTFVVGPGDHTQRFTWWVDRVSRGGDVLAPGNPATAASLIDVRDLANFFLHLLERDTAGIFNAAGPAGIMGWGSMLGGIQATTTAPVRLHWLPLDFLNEHKVSGSELPMWNPGLNGQDQLPVEYLASVQAGLRFRPLARTVRDTRQWHNAQPEDAREFTRAGLAADKEARVLKAWLAQRSDS